MPTHGNRLYELQDLTKHPATTGRHRRAELADKNLILSWINGFMADIGEDHGDQEPRVTRRLAAGQFWIWEDGEPVSMALHSVPVESVVRVQAVYTPPDRRNCGYASACVSNLSAQLMDQGYRCILYTDLANPVSNSIYRRIGYRAFAELLKYRFDSATH
jgi:predicted GNAT family acetyltransferase